MSSTTSTFASHLPPHEGLLPKWLLLVSIISIGNSIQAYSTLTYTRRVYSGTDDTPPEDGSSKPSSYRSLASPVNNLSARTFGTWTVLSSIIRLYAAYNIDNPKIYELALWTYGVAFAHFASEWLVFGSARWGAGLAGPAIVSTASMLWMWAQWGYYVQ